MPEGGSSAEDAAEAAVRRASRGEAGDHVHRASDPLNETMPAPDRSPDSGLPQLQLTTTSSSGLNETTVVGRVHPVPATAGGTVPFLADVGGAGGAAGNSPEARRPLSSRTDPQREVTDPQAAAAAGDACAAGATPPAERLAPPARPRAAVSGGGWLRPDRPQPPGGAGPREYAQPPTLRMGSRGPSLLMRSQPSMRRGASRRGVSLVLRKGASGRLQLAPLALQGSETQPQLPPSPMPHHPPHLGDTVSSATTPPLHPAAAPNTCDLPRTPSGTSGQEHGKDCNMITKEYTKEVSKEYGVTSVTSPQTDASDIPPGAGAAAAPAAERAAPQPLSTRVGGVAKRHHSATPRHGALFLLDGLLFVLFMALFSALSLHDRKGPDSYQAQEALRGHLGLLTPDDDFAHIPTLRAALDWLVTVYEPNLRASTTAVDIQMHLLSVNVRQLRTRPGAACAAARWLPAPLRRCHAPWAPEVDDTAPFTDARNQTWTYISPDDQRLCITPDYCSFPIISTPSVSQRPVEYPSGGFIWPIDVARGDSFADIVNASWVTSDARVVIIETTFYNPSTNLFVPLRVVFECPVSGGIVPRVIVLPSLLLRNPEDAEDQAYEDIDMCCLVYCCCMLLVCVGKMAHAVITAVQQPQCLVCDQGALVSGFAIPWYECRRCAHCFDRRFHAACPNEPGGTDRAAPPCGEPVEEWQHSCWRKYIVSPLIYVDLINFSLFVYCWNERRLVHDSARTVTEWLASRYIVDGPSPGFVLQPDEMWPDIAPLAYSVWFTLRLSAINMLLCYFKLSFKYLSRFAVISVFSRIFQNGWRHLTAFWVFLISILIGFALAFHMNFATARVGIYASWPSTMMQVLVGLLRCDVEYSDVRPSIINHKDYFVGRAIYIAFMFFAALLMVNVLIGIIVLSYEEVYATGPRDDLTSRSVGAFGADLHARWWTGSRVEQMFSKIVAETRKRRFMASIFTVDDIHQAWKVADTNRDGYLDDDEIRVMGQELGFDLADGLTLLLSADRNNDGRLSQGELVDALTTLPTSDARPSSAGRPLRASVPAEPPPCPPSHLAHITSALSFHTPSNLQPSSPLAGPPAATPASELQLLASLRDSGVLSEEEFLQAKEQLLPKLGTLPGARQSFTTK